jgi:hypothetical protein
VVTRVFISYAREPTDPAHDEAVRQLWLYLRTNGVDARIDLPAEEQPQDWSIWMLREVREARFVLVIASAAYRRRGDGEAPASEGRGVQWEAALIREEVYTDREAATRKFLPVVLPGQSVEGIPTWLGPNTTTHYDLTAFPSGDTERLLRLFTDQPYELDPPLGPPPVLPPRLRHPPKPKSTRTRAGVIVALLMIPAVFVAIHYVGQGGATGAPPNTAHSTGPTLPTAERTAGCAKAWDAVTTYAKEIELSNQQQNTAAAASASVTLASTLNTNSQEATDPAVRSAIEMLVRHSLTYGMAAQSNDGVAKKVAYDQQSKDIQDLRHACSI